MIMIYKPLMFGVCLIRIRVRRCAVRELLLLSPHEYSFACIHRDSQRSRICICDQRSPEPSTIFNTHKRLTVLKGDHPYIFASYFREPIEVYDVRMNGRRVRKINGTKAVQFDLNDDFIVGVDERQRILKIDRRTLKLSVVRSRAVTVSPTVEYNIS
eukprot:1007094_1